MSRSAEYEAVLASPRWRAVRAIAGARCRWRCERCGRGGRLDAHHWRGYAMLGREDPADLIMVCRPCHRMLHGGARRSWGLGMLWGLGVLAVLFEVLRWLLRQLAGA